MKHYPDTNFSAFSFVIKQIITKKLIIDGGRCRGFKILFSPVKIGNMVVPNRFVVPQMGTNLANADGTVSEEAIDYWKARAEGGWGLLIVEVTAIDPLGKAIPYQPGLWDDSFIPGFKKLVDAVHRYGAKIAVQLHHAGRQTSSQIIGKQPVAPSPIPCLVSKEMPRELSTSEVYELVEKFGDAAIRAREAGFDAVEVHGAHGYLIAQFMSPHSNKRVDEFGGSFHNRIRFPVEVMRDIRRKVGGSYPIIFRISANEKVTGGRTVDESRAAARVIESAGADALHVSIGVYGSMQYIVPPADIPPGFILSDAEEIKKAVSVPIIGVGRINDPVLAMDAILSGKADLLAWGRQSLADPDTPNKISAGLIEEISPCIACNQGCIGYIFNPEKMKATCLVNQFCGREGKMKIKPYYILKSDTTFNSLCMLSLTLFACSNTSLACVTTILVLFAMSIVSFAPSTAALATSLIACIIS